MTARFEGVRRHIIFIRFDPDHPAGHGEALRGFNLPDDAGTGLQAGDAVLVGSYSQRISHWMLRFLRISVMIGAIPHEEDMQRTATDEAEK